MKDKTAKLKTKSSVKFRIDLVKQQAIDSKNTTSQNVTKMDFNKHEMVGGHGSIGKSKFDQISKSIPYR